MSFENDFLDLMPHSIIVNSFSSINGYGKPTFATAATTYQGLIQYKQKLIKTGSGQEKISTAQVVLNCTGTINSDDKITLSDGTIRPILGIERLSDDEGQHHIKISFG